MKITSISRDDPTASFGHFYTEYELETPLNSGLLDKIDPSEFLEVVRNDEYASKDGVHTMYEIHEYYFSLYPGLRLVYRKELGTFILR